MEWDESSATSRVPVHSTSAVVMENMGTADPFERAFTYRDNRLVASKCLSVHKYRISCYWTDYREICFSGLPWKSVEKILMWLKSEEYDGWNFNSGNYLFTTDTK